MCWCVVLSNWICLTELRTAYFFTVIITIVITKLDQLPLKLVLRLQCPSEPVVCQYYSTLKAKSTASPQSSAKTLSCRLMTG